jgi:lipopolysaccharide export system protein LptC
MKEVTMNYRILAALSASLLMWSCSGSSKPASTSESSGTMMAKDSPAAYYAEESHKGRLYVFGTEKAHAAFKETQHTPTIAKTFIGAGPEGQSVVLEADAKSSELQERLKTQYEARHTAKLQ